MKLAASIIVAEGEETRYLGPVLDHLRGFTDVIRAVLDGPCYTDTHHALGDADVWCDPRTRFFEHEGHARQRLLDWTFSANPTHILSLDCDEFVSDGQALRRFCETDAGNGAWAVNLEEVWRADDDCLWLRKDGAWGLQSRSPLLYRVPVKRDSRWRIMDRPLACGREPMAVRQLAARAVDTGVSVLHFGWANASERADRYARYVLHDGGKYHRRQHLDSIMWPEPRVRLEQRGWPEALLPFRDVIEERANRLTVEAA